MNSTTDTCQGFPGWRWSLPNGDSVFVAQQGAQVLSWQACGQERLYLSPKALSDGTTSIRGGVPICFPQFNQRGPLPKHGFARNLAWQSMEVLGQEPEKVFQLESHAETGALWPFPFKARLTVTLQTASLKVALTVHNTGVQPLDFTGALHTYLAVSQIEKVGLQGQAQQNEWDAVQNTHQACSGHLKFESEFDRVYDVKTEAQKKADNQVPESGQDQDQDQVQVQVIPTWTLQDVASKLQIFQSPSWGQSVVWNPGAKKCAQIADMPDHGYQHMLCVEAARVTSSIQVLPGQSWTGWQQLKCLPSC